ncbi:MAG: hypothetical protein F4X48_04020 [Acidimicrobiia bacterium]|nr:hypothetical protein [Acidimicrobiia bacterium]MYC57740.1 hypothetical protein [Acidimicrobiia bacterium]MYI29745.1 hypothetical protein [Acidimicrobiia bacterium]
MPVSPSPKLTPWRAVAYTVVSLSIGVGLVFAVVSLAGSGSIEVKLGDDDFNAGNASELAVEIVERGPITWAPLSRGRSIWINHVGADVEQGWFAFDVQSPEAMANCVVEWDEDRGLFVDACDPDLVYPATGEGLTQFGAIVNDNGDLIVDVNANDSP